MLTYEMIGLADENGREYESVYGTYTKEEGFKFNDAINPIIDDEGWRGFINLLFHENMWKLKKEDVKEMTLKDLERELGYKIRIVDPETKHKEYEELSSERKEEIQREVNFLNRLFGLNIDPEEYY